MMVLPVTYQSIPKSGQSAQAPSVNSSPLVNMFTVATPVQQILTVFNSAVSEEAKILVSTITHL